MGKKDVYKWIKEQAKLIPEEGYMAMHRVAAVKGEDGVRPEMHKANHERRLRAIWNRTHDMNELNKYFLKFNLELKYDT